MIDINLSLTVYNAFHLPSTAVSSEAGYEALG